MASPSRKFRYPNGVIPGNVEHFEGNSHEPYNHGSGLHHVFELTIPIIMGIFVILFFLFTTVYLGFSLIKLYYSDTLKPYKTKTLKSLGKHRHYYVGGESVSYITEGTRKSSSSISKVKSKSRRFGGDNSKAATSAASTARRSELSLKPGEPTPDFILLPRDLPVLSRFPSGKGMQKFYVGSSDDASRRISASGLLTNRKGDPWEWDQEWYPKSSKNRAVHRKSLDMLRSTHSQLQMKTVGSFPKELAKSDVSMPELTDDRVREKPVEYVQMPMPMAVVTEPTPETSEQSVPPPMSASEPINPTTEQIPTPANAMGGQGQTLQRRSYSTSRMSEAVSKLLASALGLPKVPTHGILNRKQARGIPRAPPSRGMINITPKRGMLIPPSRRMITRTSARGMPTRAPEKVNPAGPMPTRAPDEVNPATGPMPTRAPDEDKPSEPMPRSLALPPEAMPVALQDISSTEDMSTDDAELVDSSQVVSTQPSRIVGRGQIYSRPQPQRQGRGQRHQGQPGRGNLAQERRAPRPYSPWNPAERDRERPSRQPKTQKKRRNMGKRVMPLPPTTYPGVPQETQEEATTTEGTQPMQDDGNKAELGVSTEEPPPDLTPLKFKKQPQPNRRPPPAPPIWEREPRPVTPSRAELYSRYTFKLDDTVSSRAHTAIPRAKKQPWDKGLLIIRGGPRRKSKDIEEIKEKRKSNEDGEDVPPLLKR